MKRSKKVLLSLCIAALVLLGTVCGGVLYVYTHPSTIKPIVEKIVSNATGTSVTIETLSYSLDPLAFQAKGILLRSGEDERAFRFEVHAFNAAMALTGPFAHKTLVFHSLRVDGFSLDLAKNARFPQIRFANGGGTFGGGIVKKLVGLFLFRDIKFQQASLQDGDITAQGEAQILRISSVSAKLGPDGPMVLTCRAAVDWLSGDTRLSVPAFRVATENGLSFEAPETKGTLTAEGATFRSPGTALQGLNLEAKLIYDNKSKTLSFEPLDLSLENLSLKRGTSQETIPVKMRLNTTGHVSIPDRRIDAGPFLLTRNDTIHIGGQVNADFRNQPRVDCEIRDSRLFPQTILSLLPGNLRESLPPLKLSGPVGFTGHINGTKQPDAWQWCFDLEALLDKNPFSYAEQGLRLSSKLTGNIRAEGTFPAIQVSGRMAGEETVFAGKGLELEPFPWNITLTGKHPLYEITDLEARIPRARAVVDKKTIPVEDIRIQSPKGSVDSVRKSFRFPDIRFDSSLLKNLHVSLEHDGNKTTMGVEGKEVHLLESAQALNLIPEGWQIAGRDRLWLKTVLEDDNRVSFATKLDFEALRFQDRTSNFVGEKISLGTHMSGSLNLKDSHITLETSLDTRGGEILLDRFYFDLNSNAFFTFSEAGYDMSRGALRLSNLKAGLKNIVSLDLEGTAVRRNEDTLIQLSVRIPRTPVKPLFDHFLADPYKAERPFLTAIALGGNVSADVTVKGAGSDWTVAGHTRWDQGEILSRSHGGFVRGMDLDLPIWYQTRGVPSEEKTIKGGLSIRSLALPGLPKQSLKMPLDATGPNRLSIPTPTILVLPGGDVQLGPIFCSDIFSSRLVMDTSLTVKHHDLKPILSRIWPRPIEGTLDGELVSIHVDGDTASSRGVMRAKVFGGEIILSDFGSAGLFSSTPLFKVNARFRNLLLAELTADTSFGKVEGVLEGYVRNLEFAYGQPQSFDLLLETVEKKGVRQRISVKAVDNIARLGGGQSPFVGLASIYTSFFKEFPYEKIGVRAVLKNDVFKINGTIKEGGKEYLIKKGGFSGVDVINQNPDNRQSFKEMVKTIKRIMTDKGGPVIK